MVFKLIPWNYPFSSWVGYGTLDMIEGGGHSHELSSVYQTAASSHICNKVCRKIIRMPAYLNPHKRPKKRRDEKSGSAQQGEKLGCGHHHAETHQSPIETSSISPSYTPYAAAERRWKISALKMDDSTWESWLMRKSFIKDVFLLHFFFVVRDVVSSFPQYHVAACTRFWPLLCDLKTTDSGIPSQQTSQAHTWFMMMQSKKCVQKVKNLWQHLVKLPLNTRGRRSWSRQ